MPVSTCVLHTLSNLTRGARPYGLTENVMTDREFRNRGSGTALLNRALGCAWNENCYKVMLLTGRSEPNVLWLYEKAGFIRGFKEGLIAYPPENTPAAHRPGYAGRKYKLQNPSKKADIQGS